MVTFRPYRDGDAAGVAALLEDSAPPLYRWKLHALHGPGRDEPSRWRTRVAVGADGDIRGAVTAAHHSVHRGQYVLAVTVAPAHRRHGLGRELVAEGLRMRTEPLPMTMQFLESDEAGAGLVRSAGGVIIQTTPGFRVDPVAMRDWIDAQPVPPGVVLDDLTGFPRTELVEAHRHRYLWQHGRRRSPARGARRARHRPAPAPGDADVPTRPPHRPSPRSPPHLAAPRRSTLTHVRGG